MAERACSSVQTESRTVTVDEVEAPSEDVRTVTLTLKKPKSEKQVKWTEGTVDNENMNKKKSKCCCIYEKPRNFGESSSESDDECENCFGHVERKKKYKKMPPEDPEVPNEEQPGSPIPQ